VKEIIFVFIQIWINMSEHKLIRTIIRKGQSYCVITADGAIYIVSESGEVLDTPKTQVDPMVNISRTKKYGEIVELDGVPTPVEDFINSLEIKGRFPKCCSMLSRIPKGGAPIAGFNAREKQMLNELVRHGLLSKTTKNYIMK